MTDLMSTEQLHSRINDSDLRILDCRFVLSQPEVGREAYLQGHIPGAVFADLDKDLAGPVTAGSGRHPLPQPADLALTFGRLGISAETEVVVYDESNGGLAARAWWLLRWLGHEQVTLLEGGISRWLALGLPLDSGDVTAPSRDFSGSARNEYIVETDEIVAHATGNNPVTLVDARDAARYAGEVEPIDKVAGHIPGSVNFPFQQSLNTDGTWKPAIELQELWASVLGSAKTEPINVMCGSGVTACHLIISARLAGLAEPRLYVGSWSEWIENPDRPIATESAKKR
jgi:thiosulfate/3-mercaptopyruvate sulfurtransferase